MTETTSALTFPDAPKRPTRIVVDPAYRRFRSLYDNLLSLQTTDLLWQQLEEDERQCLGGDFETALKFHKSALGFWIELHDVSKRLAVIQASAFLERLSPRQMEWLCRTLNIEDNSISTRLGENDPKSAIEHAISTTDLVIIENPRELYWRRNVVDIDWNRRTALWEFMVEIGRRAKRGRDLRFDEFRNFADVDALPKMASRLTHTPGFPADLASNLSPSGKGAYRLTLRPDQIRVFSRHVDGVLKELR